MSDDKFSKSDAAINAETGLPEMTEQERDAIGRRAKLGFIMRVAMLAIGCGLAYPIYRFGDKDQYDARILLAKEADQQWTVLGMIIFALVVEQLNRYPMQFKERFMNGRKGGNLRANQFVYRLATDTDGQKPVIVLNQEGDIGKYNRANRSLTHFLENAVPFVAALPVNFFLFPIPTFILACTYFVGRVTHQTGYANGGWGSHGCGFLIVMLASQITVGLMIIAYIQMVF